MLSWRQNLSITILNSELGPKMIKQAIKHMDYSCAKYVTMKSLPKNVSRIVKIIHKSLVQVSIGGVYCLCRSKEILK